MFTVVSFLLDMSLSGVYLANKETSSMGTINRFSRDFESRCIRDKFILKDKALI